MDSTDDQTERTTLTDPLDEEGIVPVDDLERIRGSILGLAIGDALGHPTEFVGSVRAIRERWGESGVVDLLPSGRHPAGTFTDDTQMAICVARALIRAGHAPLDD